MRRRRAASRVDAAGPRAAVVGAINLDATHTSHRPAEPGETLPGSGYLRSGGKGANQAVALAAFGVTTTMVGRVGDDAIGTLLVDELVSSGVETQLVARAARVGSGLGFIRLEPAGGNTTVIEAGANRLVTPEFVIDQLKDLNPEVVVCQLEVPLESSRVALGIGRAKGAITVLNAAPLVAGVPDLLELVDYLILNQSEFFALTGHRAERDSVEDLRQSIRHPRLIAVFVTLGADGVLVATRADTVHVPAPRVQRVVDPTGAGDVFCAAAVAGILAGLSVVDAGRVASVAGASAVRFSGARVTWHTTQLISWLIHELKVANPNDPGPQIKILADVAEDPSRIGTSRL